MSQRLILPFKKNLISAGYKNKLYYKKYGYNHFGLDLGCEENGFNVFAIGNGQVLSCGLNNGAINRGLGNCIVIKYNDVECSDGIVRDLICQMFHFDKLFVHTGQNVDTNTIVGLYGNSGVNYNPSPKVGRHLHIQFSTEVSNPSLAYGIAVTSSGNVVKSTSKDNTVNPTHVWFKGTGQAIRAVSANWCSSADVVLKNVSHIFVPPQSSIGQRLVLPVNNMLVTCSYKNKPYETKFKIGTHYGIDFAGDRQIWGSGDGVVVATGIDNCFGKFAVVKYSDAMNHKTGQVCDVIFRYFHMSAVSAKQGDKINKDTKIGIMGMTGKYANAIHMHLEADTDIPHWNYTPTLVGNTNCFRAGSRGKNDTTFNAIDVLYVKVSSPDNQRINRTKDVFTCDNDISMPKLY